MIMKMVMMIVVVVVVVVVVVTLHSWGHVVLPLHGDQMPYDAS